MSSAKANKAAIMRERIVNAAIIVFAEKGYHLGNMNDIARAAASFDNSSHNAFGLWVSFSPSPAPR